MFFRRDLVKPKIMIANHSKVTTDVITKTCICYNYSAKPGWNNNRFFIRKTIVTVLISRAVPLTEHDLCCQVNVTSATGSHTQVYIEADYVVT